jgi:hypothetical protein
MSERYLHVTAADLRAAVEAGVSRAAHEAHEEKFLLTR